MKIEDKIITWSDGRKNPKFIPQGGEILKYIGGEVLMIKFGRGDQGDWTTEKPIPVFVVRIGDFDPLTGTYQMIYKEKDSGEENLRITPEGFSWNNPESDGWMIRFVSYSNHFKMMEEELFYSNLKTRYMSDSGVLGPQELSQFSTGKERKKRLGSLNYIAGVIDTDVEGGLGEGILSFRVFEVTSIEKRGKKWSLGVKDQDGDLILIPKYTETEDGHWISPGLTINGKLLGDLKFLDIES